MPTGKKYPYTHIRTHACAHISTHTQIHTQHILKTLSDACKTTQYCVYVHGCACSCEAVCVPASRSMGQPWMSLLRPLLLIAFEAESLMSSGTSDLAKLAEQRALGIHLSPVPQ